MTRAPFIAVYGINNIGKTTQVKKLVAHLNSLGYNAERIKYPVYDSQTGQRINAILRENAELDISQEDFQKIYIQNRKDYEPTLIEKLKSGIIIIAEDYVGTGISWGVSKGIDYEWSKQANAHLLREDLAILMDGDPFLEAQEAGHLHEMDQERMKRVRGQLKIQAQDYGYHTVHVRPGIEGVFNDVLDIVREYTDLRV